MTRSHDDDIKMQALNMKCKRMRFPLDWNFDEMEEDEHMHFRVDDVLSEESDFYELNESRQWPIKRGEYSNMRANEESNMGNLEPADEGGFPDY